MKTCSKCKEEKLHSQFYINKRHKDGLSGVCIECQQKKNKKYREENKGSISIQKKAYYNDNKKHISNIQKMYSAGIGYKLREKKQLKRQLAIRETEDGSITTESKQELYMEQDGYCGYCNCDLSKLKKKHVHLDHVIPLSKGGKHVIENILWCCNECNLSKGSKTIKEWKGALNGKSSKAINHRIGE